MAVKVETLNLRTPAHRREAREALYHQCAQKVVDALADIVYDYEAHKAADELEAEAHEARRAIAEVSAKITARRSELPAGVSPGGDLPRLTLELMTLQQILAGIVAQQQELRDIDPPELGIVRLILARVLE